MSCGNCLLCRCKSEYIDNGKIVSQDELKYNLKIILADHGCEYWKDTMLKYFIDNIDSFEDYCNDILWDVMEHKLYDLFDKCIECYNLKLSNRYFWYQNSNVVSNPYYIEKFEKKGKYFSDIEIESLFNNYIKKSEEFDESIKYYINKNVKIYKSNYDEIKADKILKLIDFGFINIDYVKFLSHKIKKKKYKFVIQIMKKIEMDSKFINFYEILLEMNKKVIEKHERNRNILIEYVNDPLMTKHYLLNLDDEYYYIIPKEFVFYLEIELKTVIKKSILPDFDEKYFNIDKDFANCLKFTREALLDYFKKKLKMRFHLQKVLCNDVVRYIQTFY